MARHAHRATAGGRGAVTRKAPDHPPIVLIRWRDALNAGGWTPLPQSIEYAADAFANPLLAAGFLLHESDEFVVVAVAYNPNPDPADVTGAMMIPRSEVVEIVRLRG